MQFRIEKVPDGEEAWTCPKCENLNLLNAENARLYIFRKQMWFNYMMMICPKDEQSIIAWIKGKEGKYEYLFPTAEITEYAPDRIVDAYREFFEIEDIKPHKLNPYEEVIIKQFHEELEDY